MLLIKTAFKNIIGSGKRTWLNVTVLSLTLIIMIAFYATIDGFIEDARNENTAWEIRDGQIWHPEYDRYDVFTLQDAHGAIPAALNACIHAEAEAAVPVLVLQGTIFPQGRMYNVLLKGIPASQTALKLPSWEIKRDNSDDIPVIIGRQMATSAKMKTGDRAMLRWRDKNGVFDARQIVVVHIFDTKQPTIDAGQVWLDLDDLYAMTGLTGEATYFVVTKDCPVTADVSGWLFKDRKFLMKDIDMMAQASHAEGVVFFIILLSIALLSVFDTQVLSIFRRQKEIGTYVALGLTPRKVMQLFTIEGTTYSMLAGVAAALFGTPLFWLYARHGYPVPMGEGVDFGMAVGNALYPAFKLSTMLITFLVVVVFSALISYLPARKIARQNMVLALKGKII